MQSSPTRRDLLVAASALFAPWMAVRAQSASARPGGALLIGGTGAGLGPVQRVSEAGGLGALSFVPNLGTGGGLKALVAGAIDIAMTARRLSDEEKAKGLVEREVFRTPVVWGVHEGVPLRRVTLDELTGLYAARTPNWSNGLPVRLVLRPETDTDTRFVKSLGPAMAEAVSAAQARPGVLVATTDTDTTDALERIVGSLGVTTLGLIRAERRRVHVLELDNVAPSVEAMQGKRYPHVKSLYVVTRGAPSGALAHTLEALTGRVAAATLSSLGCWPVSAV